jgi:hypothetical protein
MWATAGSRMTGGHPFAPSIASIRGSSWRGAGKAEPPDTKGKTMSIKLTGTQLVMLSAAAQREDRCIAAPPSLKGAAAQKIAAKLAAVGLAKEVKARQRSHIWRRDEPTGQAYALELTAAGLKAIRVEEAAAFETAAEISPTSPGEGPKNILDHEAGTDNAAPLTATIAPREGSKLAAVVSLLRREGGATIDQLAAAMGWLPHTTRAALTGLRKRGFGIERREEKGERAGTYVIVDGSNAARR